MNKFKSYIRIFGVLLRVIYADIYQGSKFSLVWSFLSSFVLSLVLYFAFQTRFSHGLSNEDYFLYVISGTVFWNLFSTLTFSSSVQIRKHYELVKNLRFNTEILVLSFVVAAAIKGLFEIIIILIMALSFSKNINPYFIIFLPISVLCTALLCCSISVLLSIATAFFKDTHHVWNIINRIVFFVTPIFFLPNTFTEEFGLAIRLNPISHYLIFFRYSIFGGNSFMLKEMVFLLFFSVAFVVGVICTYRRFESRIIENV